MYSITNIEDSLKLKILLRKTIYSTPEGMDFIKKQLISSLNAQSIIFNENDFSLKITLYNPNKDISSNIENVLKDTFTKFKSNYISEFGSENYSEMLNDQMIKFLYDIIPFSTISYIIKL